MRRKLLLPLLLLVVCMTGGVLWKRSKPIVAKPEVLPGPPRIGWLTIVDEGRPPEKITDVTPEEMPAFVMSIYRLKPDRRLLYAAAEIRRLATGDEKGPLLLRFESDGWVVRLGGDELGRLPALPTFADGQAFLKAVAKHEAAKLRKGAAAAVSADVVRDVTSGPVPKVFLGLSALDRAWEHAPGDAELLRLACHGLTWLHVQALDEHQLADPLLGRAWALLALGQTLRPNGWDAEETLLARQLGYDDAAERAAAALPQADPIRLYATFDRKGLEAVARAGADPVAQYLFLRLDAEGRCCRPEPAELPRPAWGAEGALPLLAAEAAQTSFGSGVATSQHLLLQSFADVRSSRFPATALPSLSFGERLAARFPTLLSSWAARPPEARTKEFEAQLSRRARRLAGTLLDRDSIQGFYRADFYSSMHKIAHHAFDQLSSMPMAVAFAERIADPADGTALELKRWIVDRAAQANGEKDGRERAARDLGISRSLGLVPLQRIQVSVRMHGKHLWDLVPRRPLRGYFEVLDTRPSALAAAAVASHTGLYDLRLTELYLAASVAESRAPWDDNRTWLASLRNDADALRRIVADSRRPGQTRGWALQKLRELHSEDPPAIRDLALSILRADPRSTPAQDALLEALEGTGALPLSTEELKSWLTERGVPPEVDWVHDSHFATVLAEHLLKAGRLEEAWDAVEIARSSFRFEGVDMAVAVLLARDRTTEALDLAEQLRDRYSDSPSAYLRVAEVRWRRHEPREAGEALLAAKPRMSGDDWKKVARRFATVFAKGNPEEAEPAFRATLRLGFDPPVFPQEIPRILAEAGDVALALRLSDILIETTRGTAQDFSTTLQAAYLLRRQRYGEETALAWLRGQMPVSDANNFIMQLYTDGLYELIWALYPPERTTGKQDVPMTLRLAALVALKGDADPVRRAPIEAYLATRPATEEFAQYGRYLLGSTDRKGVLGVKQDATVRSSESWIFGLKAAREGRYEEANRWLHVAVEAGAETGQPSDPPMGWSISQLLRWRDTGKLLSAVAKEGLM